MFHQSQRNNSDIQILCCSNLPIILIATSIYKLDVIKYIVSLPFSIIKI